ncbi:DUF397 domain-containing protein [Actinacidiphila paucisporea]|uniref:DUF397 domain-containing protein n=1 Tax=Actinacidiphila paucisporea TaxID=310782 RepID=A0A1M6VBU2_9ACTN|nr:DUF397 domain-containing protein [Actinacidiphila paucisporea]SHK78962.1 protein of unknown function [Actinacidiphila paucisporea]
MSTSGLTWFKSSYSGSQDNDCIEVALSWHKSSHSSGSSGDCIEVATCPDTVHVRDSKDKEGPQLAFSPTEWSTFIAYARAL